MPCDARPLPGRRATACRLNQSTSEPGPAKPLWRMLKTTEGGSVKKPSRGQEPVGGLSSLLLDEARLPRRPTPAAAAERSTATRAATARRAPPAGSTIPSSRRPGGCSAGRTLALVTVVMSYFETSDRPRSLRVRRLDGAHRVLLVPHQERRHRGARLDRRARALRRGGALLDPDDPRHRGHDRGRRQDQQAFDAATKTCLDGVEDADAGPEPHK